MTKVCMNEHIVFSSHLFLGPTNCGLVRFFCRSFVHPSSYFARIEHQEKRAQKLCALGIVNADAGASGSPLNTIMGDERSRIHIGSRGRLHRRARSLAHLDPRLTHAKSLSVQSERPSDPAPPLPTLTLSRKPVPQKTGHALHKQPPLQAGSPTSKRSFNEYIDTSTNISAFIQTLLKEIVVYKPADPLMHAMHFFKKKVEDRFVKDVGDPAALEAVELQRSSPAHKQDNDNHDRPSSRARLLGELERLTEENHRHRLGSGLVKYHEVVEEKDVKLNRLRDALKPLRTQNRLLKEHCGDVESQLRSAKAEIEVLTAQLEEARDEARQARAEAATRTSSTVAETNAVSSNASSKDSNGSGESDSDDDSDSDNENGNAEEYDAVAAAAGVVDVRTEWERMRDEGVVVGREGRRLLEERTASKIQAWFRGYSVRKQMKLRWQQEEAQEKAIAEDAGIGGDPVDHTEEHEHEEAAANVISTMYHTHTATREEHAAATKLQALHRGRVERIHIRRKRRQRARSHVPVKEGHRMRPTETHHEVAEDLGGGGGSVALNLIGDDDDDDSAVGSNNAGSGSDTSADGRSSPDTGLTSAMYEKPDAGKPSPAWKYRGPEAERLSAQRYPQAASTSAAPANLKADDQSSTPSPQVASGLHSAMYEKPEAGTPSAAWKYRGPEAEANAVKAVASRTGTGGSAPENVQGPGTHDLVAKGIHSALYEKPEAGVASPPWTYRGPEAEAKARNSA